jgi:hypothetical protein
MPLFRRSDADLVTDLSDSRRIMPYIMRGRNESLVFHSMQVKVGETRAWLREFNRARGKQQPHATLFHLLIYVCSRVFQERPGMNRFISGGRTYQRKQVSVSFVAKKRFVEDSPLVTVKLKFSSSETFEHSVERIRTAVDEGRSGSGAPIDAELRLLLRLPGPILRVVIAAGRWLDRFNLMPAALIEPDPLFCTIFLTHDGSVGIRNATHHLYEYGSCGMHAVMGSLQKAVVADRNGRTSVQEVVEVNWSFDERINDGFCCADTLTAIQRMMENPGRYIAMPDSAATSDTDVDAQPRQRAASSE